MKYLLRDISVSIVVFLVFALFSTSAAFADGEDLVVPKHDVQGIVNDPPSAGVDEYSVTKSISAGLGTFQIQTYRDNITGSVEEIQFLLTINDATSDVGDEIRIYFDVDHNHTASPSTNDKGIQIFRLPDGGPDRVKKTNVNLFGDPTDIGNLPAAQWKINTSASNWTVEAKIKAEDLSLNFVPSLMGMHIKVINSGSTTGNYPTTVNVSQITSWANLKTRRPLEYVLLLDKSGSMTTDIDGNWPAITTQRWTAAKTASDIFTQIFFALRPGEDSMGSPYFNDKIGLATYYWTGGAFQYETKPLQVLKNITVDGYVDSAPPPGDAVAGPRTPIKDGINNAFTIFSNDDVDKIVILLTDGEHNEPTLNYDDFPYIFPPGTNADDFQVNTVGFGSDDIVATDLLDDIHVDFSGFGGSYTGAVEREELVDAFSENLFSHLYLNKADVNANGEFEVNQNEPRLLVMLVWNSTIAGERGFRIKKPDNAIIDTYDPSYHHFKNASLNYEVAYYVLDFPSPSGTWQTIDLGTTSPQVADNNFALFDPTVYVFYSVVEDGDDFILRAVLKENGAPITEPGATVVVNVSKPEEGLGTYTSTAQIDCTSRAPVLPAPDQFDPKVGIQPLSARTHGEKIGETLSPRFAKVQQLFSICEKDGLNRSVQSALKLYDDGSHGDAEAGDGIFTLRYTDTKYEGTYTFKFEASGTTPSESKFSRVKSLSAHKSVSISPDNTIFDSRLLQQMGNIIYREYYVIPKDSHDGYLGPGHSNQVQFFATAGKWLGTVNDYNNGIYSMVLSYDVTQGEPGVTAAVQGKPVGPPKPIPIFEKIPWWLWLSIILILLLIILRLLRR